MKKHITLNPRFLVNGLKWLAIFDTLNWPSLYSITHRFDFVFNLKIGSLGLVWCIFWMFLATNSPKDHTFISDTEKAYLIEQTADIILSSKEKKEVPWKIILKSKPVIGLIITISCANFVISLFTTCLPSYMNDVLKFNIKLVRHKIYAKKNPAKNASK